MTCFFSHAGGQEVYTVVSLFVNSRILQACWIMNLLNLLKLIFIVQFLQPKFAVFVFVRNSLQSWLFLYHFCLCLIANGPHSIILRSNFKPPLSYTQKGA